MEDLKSTLSAYFNTEQGKLQLQQALTSINNEGSEPSPSTQAPVTQGSVLGDLLKNVDIGAVLNMFGADSQAEPDDLAQGGFDLGAILSGNGAVKTPRLPEHREPEPNGQAGGLDLSALLGMLGANSESSSQPAADPGIISSLLGSLGGGDNTTPLGSILGALGGTQPAANSGPDLSSILGALGGAGGGQQGGGGLDLSSILGALGGAGGGTGINPAMIGQLGGLLSKVNTSDKDVKLLQALKPLLVAERRPKVDSAITIMQLLNLSPLLTESGILGDLFGGLFGGGDSSGD